MQDLSTVVLPRDGDVSATGVLYLFTNPTARRLGVSMGAPRVVYNPPSRAEVVNVQAALEGHLPVLVAGAKVF